MPLNKVMLIGNVGQDPKVRTTENSKCARFTLATTERFRTQNGEAGSVTEWHNIVAWGSNADLAEKYIRKGAQLYVEGKLSTNKWQDDKGAYHSTTEIVASSIQLLDKRSSGQETSYTQAAAQVAAERPAAPAQVPVEDATSTDDLPF